MPALAPIDSRARSELAFVRDTMARSRAFSAVPGRGLVAMGGLALAGAAVAHRQPTERAWLAAWLVVAVLGFAVGVGSLALKARALGQELRRQPARGFALALLPPLVAGGLLTVALARSEAYAVLPGTWLLLYGTAVLASGLHAVRPVPWLGVAAGATGVVALAVPAAGDAAMAFGFGLLQIAFGLAIARRHGG